MQPIYQTRFGDKNGNCFNACLASIMELPIDHFPPYWEWGNEWLAKCNLFLRRNHGLQLLIVNPNMDLWHDGGGFMQTYHVISGMGPRGIYHSVVGLNGEMVHDPLPEGAGLTEIKYWELLIKDFKQGYKRCNCTDPWSGAKPSAGGKGGGVMSLCKNCFDHHEPSTPCPPYIVIQCSCGKNEFPVPFDFIAVMNLPNGSCGQCGQSGTMSIKRDETGEPVWAECGTIFEEWI